MTWTVARARHAATQVRTAPLGAEAAGAVRPRSTLGLVRDRAPLPLLLWIAARDGLVAELDNGGYAILQRPADKPARGGGYTLRALRYLDRQWPLVVFTVPPFTGLLASLVVALLAARGFAIALAIASVLWVCVFLTSMLTTQVRYLARMGAPPVARHGSDSDSLAFTHWSVRLVHQPDADRVDEILQLASERLAALMWADLQASAGERALVEAPAVTETLVILTRGITTEPARAAIAASLRAVPGYPADRDVVLLAPPVTPEQVPKRPLAGGGFLVLYAGGLAVAIAVCALLVASSERAACTPGPCTGRPWTYVTALHYLLQRLLFTDPSGLTPATARVVVLGWLVSLASVMFVCVAVTAVRQESMRNRRDHAAHDEAIGSVIERSRVLILVVTEIERDAVVTAVGAYTSRVPVADSSGERTIYTLGIVAGTEIMLAQAGEQGTATAAGMIVVAEACITRVRPDYVILTGICYGLRPDEGQRPGQVIVARRVHNIDPRKVTDDDQRPVIRRGVNVGCSPVLLDRFQAGQRTWTGSRVYFGTMLSSNTLVNSERVVCELREEFPDALGGEMEGSGVYEAATLGSKPDWIMVKAISDWGYSKNSKKQPLAARNAAQFVVHVISSGALRRRPGQRLSKKAALRATKAPQAQVAGEGVTRWQKIHAGVALKI
jgi:nucleoside phosphorylase